MLQAVPPLTEVRRALLRVPFDVALKRVQADHDRSEQAMSRDPVFLRSTHDRFAALESEFGPQNWDLDTTTMSARQAAGQIADDLLGPIT